MHSSWSPPRGWWGGPLGRPVSSAGLASTHLWRVDNSTPRPLGAELLKNVIQSTHSNTTLTVAAPNIIVTHQRLQVHAALRGRQTTRIILSIIINEVSMVSPLIFLQATQILCFTTATQRRIRCLRRHERTRSRKALRDTPNASDDAAVLVTVVMVVNICGGLLSAGVPGSVHGGVTRSVHIDVSVPALSCHKGLSQPL